MVYVDKTDMMFDLADKYSYVFLTHPRRFGKSLLCNTFKAYFKGQKELFDGLKVDGSVENALAQIDDKGYAIPYEAELPPFKGEPGRVLTKCGINISSEQRNITHWRITNAEGNVIEDKDFLVDE